MGSKEDAWDEQWMLHVSDAPLNSTPETNLHYILTNLNLHKILERKLFLILKDNILE